MNVSHNQTNRTNREVVRPDLIAFDELLERRHFGIVEFLMSFAESSISKAGLLGAFIALSYVAGK